MEKDTKPCPKCASMIFRISGCNDMWCTVCHTSFDWVSGQIIINRHIHNPHMVDWVREHGEINNGRACDDLPTHHNIAVHSGILNLPIDMKNKYHNLLTSYGHNRDVVMHQYAPRERDAN